MKKILFVAVTLLMAASGVFAQTTNVDRKGSKSAQLVYTCPMHPDVKSDKPGKCPRCGMTLVEKKGAATKKDSTSMKGMKM